MRGHELGGDDEEGSSEKSAVYTAPADAPAVSAVLANVPAVSANVPGAPADVRAVSVSVPLRTRLPSLKEGNIFVPREHGIAAIKH